MLLLGYYRFTATMYLLTQESKTWKIEEEARLRFSALNEADATHRFLTALFMDYTLLPTILSFQANSHSVSTREITVHNCDNYGFLGSPENQLSTKQNTLPGQCSIESSEISAPVLPKNTYILCYFGIVIFQASSLLTKSIALN